MKTAHKVHKLAVHIRQRLLMCLLFFIVDSPLSCLNSPLSAIHAQGLPLIRNYSAAEYGGHNRNFDIEIGDDGTIFVANFECLLYYDRSRWRTIHTPDISRITVVYKDEEGGVWVGGYNFFACLQKRDNGELFMQRVGKPGMFEGEVVEIFEDGGKVQFIATDNNIYEVQSSDTHLTTDNELLTIKKVRTTAGSLHIGVDSEIISVEALKEDDEVAVLEDITQTEKLGDSGLQVKVKKNNGLIIADANGNDLYTITEANGLCSNQVAYVAYDDHGLLWGATAHGVFSIELPSVYSYFLPKDGLSGEVHAIIAFGGKIYIGGTGGLFTISSRQCRRIDEINNICWAMSVGRSGLFVATSSGIYLVTDHGAVRRLTSNSTTSLLIDGDKIYAGESDGVWLYNELTSRPMIQTSKQSNDQASNRPNRVRVSDLQQVTTILKDGRGGLWCKNVYGETAGTPPNGKTFSSPDERNLLKPLSFFEIKAQYSKGDKIWVGGDDILAVVDMGKKDLAELTANRQVRFCSIVMQNDSVLWGGYGDMPATLPKLDSDERHLHFYYALDYAPLTGKTLYRYRLNDDKWSAWSERQDIEFLNLPSGAFTLAVQAQGADGELSEVATVSFSIAYPFFMRSYMLVFYLLVLALILYGLFRYRLKRLQKDKLKLEAIVEERTADLRTAQHELIRQEKMATVGKLTEGLIDRILNPMNYIINFSKMSNDLLKDLKVNIENNKDKMDADDYEDSADVLGMLTENLRSLNQYGQNTTRILKAMEEMLKDRTGGYVDMDLLPVLQQNREMLGNYFAKDIEQYHISTVFTLPDSSTADQASLPMHGNPDMLSKTFMSLLGNAVFATVKKLNRQDGNAAGSTVYKPEISLTVSVVDGQYILKIRDNGIGIEEKIIDKIFDPFFTTKTTDEAAGVGLYLSREIIQNHGGDISVDSVKNEYTEFTINLPVSQTTNPQNP